MDLVLNEGTCYRSDSSERLPIRPRAKNPQLVKIKLNQNVNKYLSLIGIILRWGFLIWELIFF